MDLGGFFGPPNGLLKRQLVSEKERSTTTASRPCNSGSPPFASCAALRAAAAVRSIAPSAVRGSASHCVIWPLPTRIGIRPSSIACLAVSLLSAQMRIANLAGGARSRQRVKLKGAAPSCRFVSLVRKAPIHVPPPLALADHAVHRFFRGAGLLDAYQAR